MITVIQRGNFNNIEKFFAKTRNLDIRQKLERYGEMGVQALSLSTPVRTGLTSSSWYYEIEETASSLRLFWANSNINKGVNIALIIQMGHGTRNGGYVEGIDYINPALRPIFEQMANDVWEEVTSA